MEKRPDFILIKSFEEFSKYYWYREELQKICKSLGIDSSGMKADLNHNIEEFFKGRKILPKEKTGAGKARTRHKIDSPLSLKTGIIECDFTFSQRFREFFSQQTGIEKFKFNADMVASVKKAKEEDDLSFTLGDLLDIFYGRKTYAKYDKVSLQWNKFLHDFCADQATSSFHNKLKLASILWKKVRTSTREKVYKRELLSEFQDIINQYL
ncbi:hypothetical protein DYE50_02920 [Treponema ruminis]|uniref:SAP domain-containing protein n=1 Tax=Treponema ruminis TaxID=744515 RepID=A0A7W8LN52_9SPIR|nr:SAP domain-containing protein [Treponema ruminis]MBB5227239.1 hypothetical protein [Treponema ruminis]QSI01532.1 hypothetical protein DYE50_02920 [Treponema ruminis]